ncbi:2-amino-4-hydroxy-6-hydroxymethyldihydropteridine diphosphokinase [Actinobaculum massiliense]|uniref:2-amino-4-hydroxy-6- hydroxymethyldihydropteridine diphosphokinase n=1 Tax=Actinobaculum massiliense TaxID=202789 RepID=UPI002549F36A|nr:2-amino-4-hydroxy-6-hydroxymethyldihydropteridine diphosphokinase [Actinobaculum massiliense]MDK8319433.1 2-amino-4-hydroxy-6-hydroxymethyldihydropteridine diphosphokinase [Actinobaculum massiliense]
METSRFGFSFDSVKITGVRVLASHGVFAEERERCVPFIADVEALIDARCAASGDEVAKTVSYADLADDAESVLSSGAVNLIETLAERIAQIVLARGALAVEVTVHKPEAPVRQEFADAAVTIRRDGPLLASGTIRHVVIGLGANLGDPVQTLNWAMEEIRRLPVHVTGVSQFVQTTPVLAPGQAAQPNYVNAVLTLDTALAPLELLAKLQEIEVRGGRVRHEHWGARYLDLDIETIEGVRSDYERLTLPHPRADERLFVLEPWAEIEPEAYLAGEPISELIDGLAPAVAPVTAPATGEAGA